jgi:hypothetical protein
MKHLPRRACATAIAAMAVTSGVQAGRPQSVATTSTGSQEPSAVVSRYCMGCHSAQVKSGGLTLTPPNEAEVIAHPEIWEKVIRKLRTGDMPPPGRPRPTADVAASVVGQLESQIDRHAASAPDPGRLPMFQRLTRTEYANAVRDLLLLTDLPKEMDISVLLPADNAASGFDNLRDRLFVSSTQLEGYLSAARKISRLVVGDRTMPPLLDTHTLSEAVPQDVQVDGAPFGTRGGMVIRTYLPLDGEYLIHTEISDAARDEQLLDVSVDGTPLASFTLRQPPPPPPSSADTPKASAVGTRRFERDRLAEARRASIAKGFDATVSLKAGPRVIVATFAKRSDALPEDEVIPARQGRGGLPGITTVTIRGPLSVQGRGDTPAQRRIFTCHPTATNQERGCAREILGTLARRAYRRPVTNADLQELLVFYDQGRSEAGFEQGIQQALERLLVSPQFLFRIEREPAGLAPGSSYRISDLDLASRLSFFLWSSIPDDELLDLAERGKLSEPARLEAQVRRMLADGRSKTLTNNFAAQWLFLRDIEDKHPNAVLFPEFNEGLRQAFQRETSLFVDSILRADRSLLDLLTANHTFLNEQLAKHYGVPNVYGSQFRRVELPADSPRRGLLGQGSILALTSQATRTSPVLRGKYVLDNLLASAPPPPPPNIPALPEQSSDGKALPIRAAMEQHRANPVCASCHARMDPLGFSLENFDAIGRWRTRDESGNLVDAAASLPDGTKLDGIEGLRAYLVGRPDPFVAGVTEKLLTYAIGRKYAYIDAPAVRQIVRSAAATNYQLSSLVLGVVHSVPFRMRTTNVTAASSTASRD